VAAIKRELGVRAKGRQVTEEGGIHQLQETETAYRSHDEDENSRNQTRPRGTRGNLAANERELRGRGDTDGPLIIRN
jgi:hypothetical protein